jgi:hypothetical protein
MRRECSAILASTQGMVEAVGGNGSAGGQGGFKFQVQRVNNDAGA